MRIEWLLVGSVPLKVHILPLLSVLNPYMVPIGKPTRVNTYEERRVGVANDCDSMEPEMFQLQCIFTKLD